MNEKMDTRIPRLWYFAGSWDPKPRDWAAISKYDHAFLTNAPLTFGHSQLVIPASASRESSEESELFQASSKIIKAILMTYKTIFGSHEIHTEKRFAKLAEATYSYGNFIKTLILRTSASERPECEFKVHIVPYFESNQNECHKRYHSLHRARPDDKGGLIGWLGDRETEVDTWLTEGFPGSVSLDDIGSNIWRLPELADLLKQTLLRQQANQPDTD